MLANKDNHSPEEIKTASGEFQKDSLKLFEMAYKKVSMQIGSFIASYMVDRILYELPVITRWLLREKEVEAAVTQVHHQKEMSRRRRTTEHKQCLCIS